MPFYQFKLDSTYLVGTVIGRLRAMTRAERTFKQFIRQETGLDPESDASFVGEVDGNAFRVQRLIRYRNTFLPRVSGRVSPTPRGCDMRVTMVLGPFAAVFTAVWMGLPLQFAFQSFASPGGSPASIATSLVFVLFGIALTAGGFFFEALKARRLLEACTAGDP